MPALITQRAKDKPKASYTIDAVWRTVRGRMALYKFETIEQQVERRRYTQTQTFSHFSTTYPSIIAAFINIFGDANIIVKDGLNLDDYRLAKGASTPRGIPSTRDELEHSLNDAIGKFPRLPDS